MVNNWDEALVIIYFGYGLAFYSMGLALLVESGRASELSLARSIRLLAGFGLLHGIHEWMDMMERVLIIYQGCCFPEWLSWLRVSILITSFVALLVFGESLLRRERHSNTIAWKLTIGAIVWYTVSAVLIQIIYDLKNDDWLVASDALARYVIGIPGSILACIALLQQRAAFREQGMERFTTDLTLAAIALILYGIIGQVVVPESKLFPSTHLNSLWFRETFGFPIELLRAIIAAGVAVFMIHVLRVLEIESQQKLKAVEDARQNSEIQSSEQLAQLNAELQIANRETERLLQEVQRRDARRGVLLQHITAAQESERQRIARELHDDTGQALTGLAMGLRGVSSSVARLGDTKVAAQLADLESIATNALTALRILINDLRPPQLDDMGLVAAIRWMANRVKERSKLHVELQVEGDPYALPSEVETTIFRMVQEGLNNIVKHAHAENAWVTLHFKDTLELVIRDDGIGFEPDSAVNTETPHTAWGLLGMQERAGLIHAQMTLESKPNIGTTLIIQLRKEEEDAD